MRLLVLGGTTEARLLATRLVDRPGLHVVSSLAGRVRLPCRRPARSGSAGFGGRTRWRVDHREPDGRRRRRHPPVRRRMTINAAAATAAAGVPLLVLRRPGWDRSARRRWTTVTPGGRRRGAPRPGRADLPDHRSARAGRVRRVGPWFLVRSIDPPQPPAPARMHVLLDRGPFTLDGERALLREHRIDVLVTKDSGGTAAAAKLTAAREAGVPVVVQARPPLPPGLAVVPTVDEAVAWVVREFHAYSHETHARP
jgi:precorrin-6A/cobalt-precorrin-6A reductase